MYGIFTYMCVILMVNAIDHTLSVWEWNVTWKVSWTLLFNWRDSPTTMKLPPCSPVNLLGCIEKTPSGQTIATSHDLTPKGSQEREMPLLQGNLGWWNIIIWPDTMANWMWRPPIKKKNTMNTKNTNRKSREVVHFISFNLTPSKTSGHIPQDPCMVYLPTFG